MRQNVFIFDVVIPHYVFWGFVRSLLRSHSSNTPLVTLVAAISLDIATLSPRYPKLCDTFSGRSAASQNGAIPPRPPWHFVLRLPFPRAKLRRKSFMTRAEVWAKNWAKNWAKFSTHFRASYAVQNDTQIFSQNSSQFITPCLVADILKFHLRELLGFGGHNFVFHTGASVRYLILQHIAQ